jgi:ribosomal protein L11 methyltransferase
MSITDVTVAADNRPLRIGRRWLVVPAGFAGAVEPDTLAIRLAPGPVFGTGTHPTTQLCLMALGHLVKPGVSVLDLGTGTGILAIGAAKLGAGPVLAFDTDPAAVRAARENVALNGVTSQVRVANGSLADALNVPTAIDGWQVVVANILAKVILTFFEQDLGQVVSPGGWLVLSGFLPTQTPEIRAQLRRCGLAQAAQETRGDWVAIVARRGNAGAIAG